MTEIERLQEELDTYKSLFEERDKEYIEVVKWLENAWRVAFLPLDNSLDFTLSPKDMCLDFLVSAQETDPGNVYAYHLLQQRMAENESIR